MSRYVFVLVAVFLIVFTLVIGSYYFSTSERRDRDLTKSDRSKERTYMGIRPGRAYIPKLKQTKYNHNVNKSDGRANLINQPGECKLWGLPERIIGGKNADIGDFPCIALLEYLDVGNVYSFECAGSLINHRYVITAAHCLFRMNLVNIRLGEYDLENDPDTNEDGKPLSNPINVGFEKIIIHRNYSKESSINDIGLIRLSMDVPYEEFQIQPICIPDSSMSSPDDRIVVVAGWGNIGGKKRSSILQKVGVRIYNFEKCQEKYGLIKILPSQLCVGGELGKDACKRDSGGPLVMSKVINGSVVLDLHYTFLEGIVSFGIGCGQEGIPGVYTRVSYYYDWILQNLKP